MIQAENMADPMEDLAFLRSLAEQGQRAVALSGVYLIMWGVLIAAAYLNNYLARSGVQIGIGYGMMGLVGWIGSIWLGRYQQQRRAATSIAARVYASVFMASGLVLTIFAIGSALSPLVHGQTIMIVAALVMGLCFLVTGRIAQLRLIAAVGGLWFAAAIFLFTQLGHRQILLYGAVIWLVLIAGPGIWLMMRNTDRG